MMVKGTIYFITLYACNLFGGLVMIYLVWQGSPISLFIGLPNLSVLLHDVKVKHFGSIGLTGSIRFCLTQL
jgi:hypothetical protein